MKLEELPTSIRQRLEEMVEKERVIFVAQGWGAAAFSEGHAFEMARKSRIQTLRDWLAHPETHIYAFETCAWDNIAVLKWLCEIQILEGLEYQ
jgi:threonine aldolase